MITYDYVIEMLPDFNGIFYEMKISNLQIYHYGDSTEILYEMVNDARIE